MTRTESGAPAEDGGREAHPSVRPVRRTAAFLGHGRVTWRQATEGSVVMSAATGSALVLALLWWWRRRRRA